MPARPVPRPPRLYAIADADALAPRRLALAAEEMMSCGICWVQLRAKRLDDRRLCREVERSCLAAERWGAALWIDDRADLAAIFPVAGVHVGQQDLPPAAVRRVIGPEKWIGRSTHGQAEFDAAAADPEVDVVALGPIFPTTGKAQPDPVVGVELLRSLASSTEKPVIAIGGIDEANAAGVLAAGAGAVAVLGAVCRGAVGPSCRRLLAAVEEAA